ncbi:hypothetical protein [Streptomyces sp. NPDC044948]|uniref:hypothetical protein n=1 Tax=Streptomyces sp. NPDC044948 TaxID=3157092 RepID=UPI0033E45B2F
MPESRHTPTSAQLDALSGAYLKVARAQAAVSEAEAVVAQRRYESGLASNELSACIADVLYGPREEGTGG